MTSTSTSTSTQAKPAAPTSATVPATVKATVPTVSDFRAALATVDAGDVRGDAGSTLKSIALARYARAAGKIARTIPGAKYAVLSTSDKRAAALAVWEDAGYGEAPKTETRTPSARSLATYLSTFGTVASHFDYGTSVLGDLSKLESAADKIADAAKIAREDAAYSALVKWRNGLPLPVAEALNLAASTFAANEENAGHFAAWSATVRAAMPAK